MKTPVSTAEIGVPVTSGNIKEQIATAAAPSATQRSDDFGNKSRSIAINTEIATTEAITRKAKMATQLAEARWSMSTTGVRAVNPATARRAHRGACELPTTNRATRAITTNPPELSFVISN